MLAMKKSIRVSCLLSMYEKLNNCLITSKKIKFFSIFLVFLKERIVIVICQRLHTTNYTFLYSYTKLNKFLEFFFQKLHYYSIVVVFCVIWFQNVPLVHKSSIRHKKKSETLQFLFNPPTGKNQTRKYTKNSS